MLLCSKETIHPAIYAIDKTPSMPTVRSKCVKCGCSFKRLDTHLRVSATCCCSIGRRSTPPLSSINIISSTASTASNLNSSALLPGNSNFTYGSADFTANVTTTSAPTLQKQSKPQKKTQCPKGNKFFKRLDTHLRVSATCKVINCSPSLNVSVSAKDNQPCPSSGDSMFFSPSDFNFVDAAPAALERLDPATVAINTSSHPESQTKASLKLPTTSEDWEQASIYFHTTLVPADQAVSTPQEMSRMLCEGIYTPHMAVQVLPPTYTRRRDTHYTEVH